MSWSISKSGKAGEIREETAKAFAAIDYLQGNEAELKNDAADMVDKVLAVTQADKVVNVGASGHCDVVDGIQVKHNLAITIN